MNENIDISKMNKAEVLSKLYNASHPQGLGFLHATNKDMTIEEAQSILNEGHTYFDYLHGRVMKSDLSSDDFDPRLYDRDNGDGAAAQILGQLMEQSK